MKLLLVEDNPDTAKALADVFTDLFHYEVEIIGHSGKCLDTLPEGYKPDYTVFDASIPRPFLDKVLDRFHGPAVGMTGDSPDLSDGLPPGTRVFQKPVEPAVLLAALEAAGRTT